MVSKKRAIMTSYRINNNQAAISLTIAVCIFKITLADQGGLPSYQSEQNENSQEIKPALVDYVINDMTTEQNMFQNFPDEQQDTFQSNQFANTNNKSVYRRGESVVDLSDSTTSITDSDSTSDDYQQEVLGDPVNEQEYDTKSVLYEHPGHSLLKHRSNKLKRQMKHKNRKHNHKLRYRNGHKTYDTPYINAHISYYNDDDASNNGDNDNYDSMTIDYMPYNQKHATKSYNSQSKWPNLKRLQNQLSRDEEDEHLPPYIKKYKKRNRQLLDLLEGTLSPPYETMKSKVIGGYQQKRRQIMHLQQPSTTHKRNHHQHQKHHNHRSYQYADTAGPTIYQYRPIERNQLLGKIVPNVADDANFKWTIADLFKDQRTSFVSVEHNDHSENEKSTLHKNEKVVLADDVQATTAHPNELPMDEYRERVVSSSESHQRQHIENTKNNNGENQMSPRTENFIYHRVASPKLVGFSGGGGIKKRLPFVAITDRRLSRKRSNSNSMEQNQMP